MTRMTKENGQNKAGSKKQQRESEVLFSLIDAYLESGKPIGSNTLKEQGLDHLSSATIRNYFTELEKKGYLHKPHASGGRIPTNDALRLYVSACINDHTMADPTAEEQFNSLAVLHGRNLMTYLQHATETLSELSGYAAFLTSVRFDQDLILNVKLVQIDEQRLLTIIITDFGQVLTEVLPVKQKLSSFACKRIESQLQARIKGARLPENLTSEERSLAHILYNEIMVRYIVRHSNHSQEDIFRTGFSQLIAYPEFSDPLALTTGLSLFENGAHMRLLLNDCLIGGHLRCWIGRDLAPYASAAHGCCVIALPYRIGASNVGAVGILGPCRMHYKKLFGLMHSFSDCISKFLTKSLLKYKLSFRAPRTQPQLRPAEKAIVNKTSLKLLEIKDPT